MPEGGGSSVHSGNDTLHAARQATIKQMQDEKTDRVVDRSSIVCYAPVVFDNVTPLQTGMSEAVFRMQEQMQ